MTSRSSTLTVPPVAGERVPILDALRVETTTDCRSGQTVVLGGLRQLRGEPAEEIETIVLLTPEIVPPNVADNAAPTDLRR